MLRRTMIAAAALLPATRSHASMFGKSEPTEEERRAAWEKERSALADKAKLLIPTVREQQPARLAKLQAAHDADVASFKFRCERYGDYLALFMERGGQEWASGQSKYVQSTRKSVLSVSLGAAPKIVLQEGHAPDLNGQSWFTWRSVQYDGDKGWSKEIAIDCADLPSQSDKKAVAWSGGGSGYVADGLGVGVEGVARRAADDRITFGEGGGTEWDDRMRSGNSFSYSTQDEAIWKRQRPGATITAPAGLGADVYAKILVALRDVT